MDCKKVIDQLPEYVDGELGEKEARLIVEHIAVCDECSQEEQLLRKTSRLLKQWESPPTPDGFCEALLARADIETRRPRRGIFHAVRSLTGPRALIRIAACGAVVLLLCIGVIIFTRPNLKEAPKVEPPPTITESSQQNTVEVKQETEDTFNYTTMAEMKVAGMWE